MELSERERRRALQDNGKRRRVGCAANVEKSQRGQQAERGNDSDKEKREDRHQRRVAGAVGWRGHQQHEGYANCDERNQQKSSAMAEVRQ